MLEVIATEAVKTAAAAAETAEATAEAAEVTTQAVETVEVSSGAVDLGTMNPEIAEAPTTEVPEYFSAETVNAKSKIWRAIDALKFEKELPDELKACNPNYELGTQWKINCQRCVPTYEMRRRGYNVTAKPCTEMGSDYLAHNPFAVWKNPEVIRCKGNGLDQIREQMAKWGDGSRAQIVVTWKGGNGGHTFVAEQVNGKTRIFDPQTHGTDVTEYFDRVQPGSVQFCRIDNLDVNEQLINQCCEMRRK